MKVYVVIVTYNGEKWIQKCLNSIIIATIIPEIIVVDNNSTDKTVELVENFPASIQLFKQTKNIGFGQANNLGISFALKNECDYVFLLNQDAFLELDTIDKLIQIHKKFRDFGILSPIHLNGNGERLDKNFSNYLNYEKNKSFYSDFILNKVKKSPYEVPFVNAAAWLIPKSTLKLVGGFDPLFFHYGEDDNYCQKLIYENLKIGIVANSFIRHDREGVTKRNDFSEIDKLKNIEVRHKAIYANVNSNLTFSQSNVKIYFKYIYYYFLKGSKYSRFYLKSEKLKKNTFMLSMKSKDKFYNRAPYQYL